MVYQIFLSFRNNFTLTSGIILLLYYIIFFLSDILVYVLSESSTPGAYRASCEALLLTATIRLTLLLTTDLTKYFVYVSWQMRNVAYVTNLISCAKFLTH